MTRCIATWSRLRSRGAAHHACAGHRWDGVARGAYGRASVRGGHEVRLMVRRPERVAPTLEPPRRRRRTRRVDVGGQHSRCAHGADSGCGRGARPDRSRLQCRGAAPGDQLHAVMEPGRPRGHYGRSKAAAERFALALRDEGAPVALTNPGACTATRSSRRRERHLGRTECRAMLVADSGCWRGVAPSLWRFGAWRIPVRRVTTR